MLTLEYAKNPVWNSDDGQQINLTVKWEEFNEEHPFNATSFDTMPYGVDLYNRAKAGEFGAIAPWADHGIAIATEAQPTTTGSQDL
jgi:hypothetical protein